jgi:hypothetical protein
MEEYSLQQNLARLKTLKAKCDKHKHTLRSNKFGVTWCIGCGLLSSSIAEPLKEDDKIILDTSYLKN